MDTDDQIIDITTWTRLKEVCEYASARGISFSDAVRELVNTGLSHK